MLDLFYLVIGLVEHDVGTAADQGDHASKCRAPQGGRRDRQR